MGAHTKRKLTLRKRHFFVIEKYNGESLGTSNRMQSVLGLPESIMKAPGLVKEELQRILCKLSQLRPKNQFLAEAITACEPGKF